MVVVPGEDTLPVVWAGPGLADGLDPAAVAGAVLAGVGVDLPVLRPMTAAVLYLEAL
jgi:hypothetical protein